MKTASDVVKVAIVGAGGMGRGVARELMKLPDVRIVAVADPADAYQDDFFYKCLVGRLPVKEWIETHYRESDPAFVCADYKDFRVMLAEMPEIDAIVCATPDHLHAYVSVVAMRQGKHVYCEKPLAHNIWETRLMARVAEEMGVATQMGNIGHARDGMRETVEWIRDGAVGTVREVHAWAGATRWNKGMQAPPTEEPGTPDWLDWDLWIGPREPRPYHPAYFPVRWRDFWTFGLGPIGDFVCHDLDCACWALDLRPPVTVEAFSAGKSHPEMTGYGELCYYEFGASGDRAPVRVTWYDGGLRPATPADWPSDEPIPSRGVLFRRGRGDDPLSRAGRVAEAAARVPARRLHAAGAVAAALAGPPPRVDRRLQGRDSGHGQLHLLRPVDRDRPARGGGPADRQALRLEQRGDEGRGRSRGRGADPHPLPRRLGTRGIGAPPAMDFVADLHVHSRFSRATSRECTLEGLRRWALLKGVRVVGTGDFTHPEWFAELQRKLVPSAPGLFRLRLDVAGAEVPPACAGDVDLLLSAEVSCIYRRDGRVRKVHSLLLVPDFAAAAAISRRLSASGSLGADGRPTLKLDSRDLLAMVLDAHPAALLIPAHIWTPWYSALGARSGFDSIAECFGPLADSILAVETGLSSDPPMNWRVGALDRYALVSNSDLHSPANLARNATLFRCAVDYFAMREALRRRSPDLFGGTLDLFPEEGKYHLDGHRACGVCLDPEDAAARNGLCPVCGKPLVQGVLHRISELADRPPGGRPEHVPQHEYIIPLPELLAEILGVRPASRKVQTLYHELLAAHGPELPILRRLPPQELEHVLGGRLAEALRRVRSGQVLRQPGYDGVYGCIRALPVS